MPRGARHVAVAAAVALVVAPVLDAAARPSAAKKRGKVERIERGAARSRGICQLRSKQQPGQAEYSHTCWGARPALGAIGRAYDEVGLRASVKVTAIVPEIDACGQEIRWYIDLEVVTGSLVDVEDSMTFVVFGFELSRDARTRSDVTVPEARQHENVWTGFGAPDDPAELIVTYYTCDRPGRRLPSDQIWDYCIEYYARKDGEYRSIGTDYVPACTTE